MQNSMTSEIFSALETDSHVDTHVDEGDCDEQDEGEDVSNPPVASGSDSAGSSPISPSNPVKKTAGSQVKIRPYEAPRADVFEELEIDEHVYNSAEDDLKRMPLKGGCCLKYKSKTPLFVKGLGWFGRIECGQPCVDGTAFCATHCKTHAHLVKTLNPPKQYHVQQMMMPQQMQPVPQMMQQPRQQRDQRIPVPQMSMQPFAQQMLPQQMPQMMMPQQLPPHSQKKGSTKKASPGFQGKNFDPDYKAKQLAKRQLAAQQAAMQFPPN